VKSFDAPTVKAKRSSVILVVGFSPAFVRRCNEAASKVEATVVGVEAGAESTFAMQTLPLAVLMDETAMKSSPLCSIAPEIGVELIKVSGEDVDDARLVELITEATGAAERRRRPARP
jgi:hypothetical protein